MGTLKKERSSKKGLFTGLILVFFFAYLVQKEVSLPGWVLIGGAMLGFFILFLKSFSSPMPALMTLVCYIPFSKVLVGDFGGGFKALNFTNILMIFVLIGMLIQLAGKGKPLFEKNSLNAAIAVFCIITAISFIRGARFFGYYLDFVELLSQVKRWLTPPLLFFLAYNALKSKEDVKKIVIIMMVVVALVGCMATWDYMNVGSVSSLEKARIGGISDQPNQLAGFFVYYMFLYAGFFLVRFPHIAALGWLFPFLITFRGIMVTFSRGGYVAFAFAALAICFFRNKILFIIAALCLAFVAMNPQFLPGGIRYRLEQTIESDDKMYDHDIEESLEASSRHRISIWRAGLEMVKDKPVFGYGYGTFTSMVGRYDPQQAGKDAHNSYVIIAAEMGVPALLSFFWIIMIFLKEAFWVYRKAKDKFFKATALGMLGGIFGLLAVNMFGSRLNTLEISGYFWMLAGVILRMKAIEKRDRNS